MTPKALLFLLVSSPLLAAESPPAQHADAAREANRDLAMEACHKLDTSQQSDCEQRVRQGLENQVAESDVDTAPEVDPLPTDRVAPPDEPKDDDER